jgi:hypothetical protein
MNRGEAEAHFALDSEIRSANRCLGIYVGHARPATVMKIQVRTKWLNATSAFADVRRTLTFYDEGPKKLVTHTIGSRIARRILADQSKIVAQTARSDPQVG